MRMSDIGYRAAIHLLDTLVHSYILTCSDHCGNGETSAPSSLLEAMMKRGATQKRVSLRDKKENQTTWSQNLVEQPTWSQKPLRIMTDTKSEVMDFPSLINSRPKSLTHGIHWLLKNGWMRRWEREGSTILGELVLMEMGVGDAPGEYPTPRVSWCLSAAS